MAGVVAVAFSGGRDSAALLHATATAARGQGVEVVALHVHHGLLPEADAWVDHGRRLCDDWAASGLPVRFAVHRVRGEPARGDSIEAWARRVRYEALAQMARDAGATLVLLAHHRRDQAETVLLQALRGAGLAGLSAMPVESARGGITWSRPWLSVDRAAIEAYGARHGIPTIDDPSNTDLRFDRNRLRHDVWPALTAAFPGTDVALARVAHWCQQAARVMADVAAEDLARCRGIDGLRVDDWLLLQPERRQMALRAWLLDVTGAPPPATLTERLCRELPAGGSGRWPVAGGELRRFRRALRFSPRLSTYHDHDGDPETRPPAESALAIRRAGRYALPGWGGVLVASRVTEGGVAVAWLGQLELRARHGGERFQAGLGRPPRSLKKQYQMADVAAWDRAHGPLVFSGGQLVFVPALGVDARVLAPPGLPQLSLRWEHAGHSDTDAV